PAGRRQPRPRPLPPRRDLRRRPPRQHAAQLRVGHPPLSRRRPGPHGRRSRVQRAAGPVPAHRGALRRTGVAAHANAARPRHPARGGRGMSTVTGFDPFAPEVVDDPYPHYARLRDETPVAWIPEQNLWMVTRYDDVVAVLHDPSTYSSADGMGALMSGRVGRNRVDARELLGLDLRAMRVLIATDPPDHTRLRRLVARAFTPRTIAELEPHLREVCERLVDDLLAAADRGSGDLVAPLAFPFPVIVIAELLGIPPERRDDFKRWSDALVGALSGAWDPTEAQQTLAEMFMYLADVVERRHREPGDDLISRLVASAYPDDPDSLSSIEITLFAVLLLVAGNETTTNLIGNGAAALAAHPDQAGLLADRPDLLPAAVEEILRWDAPVQGLFRSTTRATTLA